MDADHRPLVLLTGASGYIGGRLLKELEKARWPVRCLARRPDFLRARVAASTEVAKADCLDRSSLAPAMAGVHTAYTWSTPWDQRVSSNKKTAKPPKILPM